MKTFRVRAMVSVYITVEAEDLTYERAEELMEEAVNCLEWDLETNPPEGLGAASIGCAYDVEFDDVEDVE